MAEMVAVARQKLESGALSEAEALCQHILSRDDAAADAWQVLGLVAQRRGNSDQAISHMRQAVAAEPRSARRRLDLAQVAMEVGAYYDAVAHLEAVVAGCGDVPVALLQLGQALLKLKQPKLACDRLERAVNADPESPAAWCDLGEAYLQLGRFEAALAALDAGLKYAPYDLMLHVRTANAMLALGRPEQAAQQVEQLRQDHAHDPRFFSCIGDIQVALGTLDDAIDSHRKAVDRAPHDPVLQTRLAYAELSAGDFEGGFERLSRYLSNGNACSAPQREAHLDLSSIVQVKAGSDLGLAVLLARYLTMASAQGYRLTLVCEPRHHALFTRSLGSLADVRTDDDAVLARSSSIDLLRLPGLVGAEQLPESVALVPDSDLAKYYAQTLRMDDRLNVGLCWQGSDESANRHHSMHLSRMLPVLGMEGVHCVSLQTGEAEAQAAALPDGFPLERPALLSNFYSNETEALVAAISAMDQVVTVDGDVAHLAGALGKPTWLLLAHDPHPLWGHTERRWYPDTRIIRQKRRNDFSAPLSQLRAALRTELGTPP